MCGVIDLYNEFISYKEVIKKYFDDLYLGIEDFYPSIKNWFSIIDNTSESKVLTYLKSEGISGGADFYNTYFYLIMKSEAYLMDFADLGLKDIKEFIKSNYKECLSEKGIKSLSTIFKKRLEVLDKIFLQEYSGKNRSKETVKKEGCFVSKKVVYYLMPLIDDLWKEFDYDHINFGELVGTRIINIRGTNGSGKTTMVKKVIERLNSVEDSVWEEFSVEEITTYHKVITKQIQVWHKQKFIVLGVYNDKQTGGVDNYSTPWQVMYALFKYIKKYKGYTILFEGVRISTNYVYWEYIFTKLRNVGVRIDIVSLLPSDVQWCLNNVIERRKDKGIWELRNAEDIKDNCYMILRSMLMFLSEGFSPFIICSDKLNGVEDTFKLLISFINMEIGE